MQYRSALILICPPVLIHSPVLTIWLAYFESQCQCDEAEPLCEECFSKCEASLSETYPNTLTSVNNLPSPQTSSVKPLTPDSQLTRDPHRAAVLCFTNQFDHFCHPWTHRCKSIEQVTFSQLLPTIAPLLCTIF